MVIRKPIMIQGLGREGVRAAIEGLHELLSDFRIEVYEAGAYAGRVPSCDHPYRSWRELGHSIVRRSRSGRSSAYNQTSLLARARLSRARPLSAFLKRL